MPTASVRLALGMTGSVPVMSSSDGRRHSPGVDIRFREGKKCCKSSKVAGNPTTKGCDQPFGSNSARRLSCSPY